MNPIKISLIGIGCLIIKGVFSDDEWDKLHFASKQMKTSLSEAVFDPSFYTILNLKGVKCYYDLGNAFKMYGLLNHYKSIIQLQAYRKRRRTIPFSELIAQNALFPLYQTSIEHVILENQKNSITMIEKDIGTTCHYKIEADGFDLSELVFQINKTTIGEKLSIEVLDKLSYKNNILTALQGTSLIQSQYAIIK